MHRRREEIGNTARDGLWKQRRGDYTTELYTWYLANNSAAICYSNVDIAVFGTKLMAIEGVPEQSPIVPPIPSITSIPSTIIRTSSSILGTATSATHSASASPTQHPLPPDDDDEPGANTGECRLLGPFALIVQAGLGFLALLSLVFKRYRERPRRPVKVWFFDASKQVFGSVLLHVLNLLMAMFSSGDFELASKAQQLSGQFQDQITSQITAQLQDDQGRRPNPCSFYLINLAIDV